MSKKILTVAIGLFLIFGNINIYADEQQLSCESETIIAFFNGVGNTERDARESLEYLKEFYGDFAPNTEPLQYELMYNTTEGFGADLVEVYAQILLEREKQINERLRDLDAIYEQLFFDIKNNGGTLYELHIGVDPDLKEELEKIKEIYQEKQQLEREKGLVDALGVIDPVFAPLYRDYAEHRGNIDRWLTEGDKLVFVAHSQGNLFAVNAYDYAIDKFAAQNSIQVVHVAPPADMLRSVNYTLANWDLVINGLRLLLPDIPPPATTYTYPLGGLFAGANGKTDTFGHGFVEVYINTAIDTAERIRGHIDEALNTVQPPIGWQAPSFFALTFTWVGQPIDISIFEPNGRYVTFGNPQGNAGYFTGYRASPENYYAYCDASKVLLGTYKVRITSADRALADIKLSSYNGVSIEQEADFWTIPVLYFNVIVAKNENGEYVFSLEKE